MATVFLNGEFVERDAARVSAFDAGLQHGVGLFETMLAVRGGGGGGGGGGGLRIIDAAAHVDRLVRSARALGLSESLRGTALEETALRTAEKAAVQEPDQERFRVRLTLTGGDLNLLETRPRSAEQAEERERQGQRGQDPTVLVAVTPATRYPEAMFERGVGVVLGDWRANPLDPFQGHKTVNYWPRLRELQRAAGKRAGEALVFTVGNHLAGGCVSNVLLVKDERVLTPIARGEEEEVAAGDAGADTDATGERNAKEVGGGKGVVLGAPVLPGVVRGWALAWAQSRGMETERRMLTINDVLDADEVVLTNSSWGVLPVVAVEAERIGSGGVGPVARQMMDAWREKATGRVDET